MNGASRTSPEPWGVELDRLQDGDIDVMGRADSDSFLQRVPIAAVAVREAGDDEASLLPAREEALANARQLAAAAQMRRALEAAPAPGPWAGVSRAALAYADWWRDVRGAALAKVNEPARRLP